MRRPLFFLLFIIFILFPLEAQTKLLQQEDVSLIMKHFFELHIDKKEISSTLIERSLKIYLTQFDGSYSYLTEDEAKSYLHPTHRMLQNALLEYEQNHFTTYFVLNDSIKKSITRARRWREEWERDPVSLVQEAKKISFSGPIKKSFAITEEELRIRQKERLLKLIAYLMQELKNDSFDGVESKLVRLCEKQLMSKENEYLGIDENGKLLSEERQNHLVILRTIKALASSLDAHTAYYSPEEAYAMKVQLEKGMCGIGVVLREGIEGIHIYEVLKGGPADKSGQLQAGDTIVEVNGENVKGASFQHVLEVMRGKAGTHLNLGIARKTQRFHVELIRSQIALEDKRVDVESEPFGDGVIGKITLHSFYEGDGVSSEKDLREAIEQLRSQGTLHGLVLDLRENSGGFLTQAVKVGGLFISSGVIVISKYSDNTIKYFRTVDGKRAYEGPLVVLISRGSASAAEIVAQALQDYGVAIVVGDEQTYGKGTIQHQTVTDKRSESFFKVTVGRYYTVSGRSTQLRGVKSDIAIPTELNFEEIGESYLEYPLSADRIDEAYEDPLTDIDPFARRWFTKYYLPQVERLHSEWSALIPRLKMNSERRLEGNRNYQLFLESMKGGAGLGYGENDLQMEESVNILKDMIYFSCERVWEVEK